MLEQFVGRCEAALAWLLVEEGRASLEELDAELRLARQVLFTAVEIAREGISASCRVVVQSGFQHETDIHFASRFATF